MFVSLYVPTCVILTITSLSPVVLSGTSNTSVEGRTPRCPFGWRTTDPRHLSQQSGTDWLQAPIPLAGVSPCSRAHGPLPWAFVWEKSNDIHLYQAVFPGNTLGQYLCLILLRDELHGHCVVSEHMGINRVFDALFVSSGGVFTSPSCLVAPLPFRWSGYVAAPITAPFGASGTLSYHLDGWL